MKTEANVYFLLIALAVCTMNMDKTRTSRSTDLDLRDVFVERSEYFITPFEIESQNYECQCESCHRTRKQKSLLPRLWITGIFCPFIWICEIALCLYLQWFVSNEPRHPPIDSDQLPTEYELYKHRENTEIEIDQQTLEDIRITNGLMKGSSESEVIYGNDNAINQQDQLKWTQLNFLRCIATRVIDSHHLKTVYLWKWVWLCTAALASYALVLGVILAATLKKWGI